MMRFTNSAEDFVAKIVLAANIIDDGLLDRVEEQTIDREIAALGVLFGGCKADAFGTASVGVLQVGPEGRDFDLALPQPDQNHPERLSHRLCIREKPSDARRRSIGRDVVVFRRLPEQLIAKQPPAK